MQLPRFKEQEFSYRTQDFQLIVVLVGTSASLFHSLYLSLLLSYPEAWGLLPGILLVLQCLKVELRRK